jgi:hypothetical protein
MVHPLLLGTVATPHRIEQGSAVRYTAAGGLLQDAAACRACSMQHAVADQIRCGARPAASAEIVPRSTSMSTSTVYGQPYRYYVDLAS